MGIIQRTRIRKTLEIGCRIASVINPYIPKRKDRILFFESTADFMNNYVLFKYMVENNYNQKYKLYYFPDIRNTAKMNKSYHNVIFSNSIFKAFVLFLTTKTVILDTGNMRMIPAEKQAVAYLDHGLPFKCAGAMSKHPDKTVPMDLIMPVNYFSCPSANLDEMYKKTYLLKQEQILRAGRPRTDALYNRNNNLPQIGIDPGRYKKVIMWMTTYRISKDRRLVHTSNKEWSETNLPILVSKKELRKMNDVLVRLNYFLVIKIHANSLFDKNSFSSYSNIMLLRENDFVSKGLQIYDLLKDFDALVTDYSSVFLDYLLVNKPIIFVTDDIEEYKEANGFYFEDPLEYMPGPKVNNFEELKNSFESIDGNQSMYEEKRKEIRDFAHQFQDGRDCERILNLLGISL